VLKGYSLEEIKTRLRKTVASGKPIIGVGVGCGLIAKCAELGGADFVVVYCSGRHRLAGLGSLAGFLPFGDANSISEEISCEVLHVIREIPVFAGVCGIDPYRNMKTFLNNLHQEGVSGIQNYPPVGVIDGTFRQNLEDTGFGIDKEVDMMRIAHESGMFTLANVFNKKETIEMVDAGVDVIVAHMGLTAKGSVGARAPMSLSEAGAKISEILRAVKTRKPEMFVLVHGGPIAELKDFSCLLEQKLGIDGFIGGTTFDRLLIQEAVVKAVSDFKSLKINP